jgi:hypothetical protein
MNPVPCSPFSVIAQLGILFIGQHCGAIDPDRGVSDPKRE